MRKNSAEAIFGIVPTPAIDEHAAVFRADENRSFSAETEVRELGYRGCEHRGQTAIDRVSAFMKDAHAGFSRVVATRRYSRSHAANGLANGTFTLYFALSQEEDGGAQEQDYRFAPHFRIIRGNAIYKGKVSRASHPGAPSRLCKKGAAMGFGDLPAEHQSDTRPSGFRREERYEKVCRVRQTGTFIADRDRLPAARCAPN